MEFYSTYGMYSRHTQNHHSWFYINSTFFEKIFVLFLKLNSIIHIKTITIFFGYWYTKYDRIYVFMELNTCTWGHCLLIVNFYLNNDKYMRCDCFIVFLLHVWETRAVQLWMHNTKALFKIVYVTIVYTFIYICS